MRMPRSFIAGSYLALLTAPALAHQPVLNEGDTFSVDAPLEIEEPEISKAFYSELAGDAHYYRIVSESPFRFYAGIAAPKIEGCDLEARFSFAVLDEELAPIAVADGQDFDWWPWYEEFGRQWYWVGPEIGENFLSTSEYEAGTYYIRVFSEDNLGQYVLAVGDIESFTPGVILRSVRIVREINEAFWDPANCDTAP